MKKTPAVAYIAFKINFENRSQLNDELKDAPLKDYERLFLADVIKGLSYKELAEKYCKSEQRIYQIKRAIFEKLHKYDLQKMREQ